MKGKKSTPLAKVNSASQNNFQSCESEAVHLLGNQGQFKYPLGDKKVNVNKKGKK